MLDKVLTMKLLRDRFAISTYDTDYILVKDKEADKAIEALSTRGYEIVKE